MKGPSCKCQTDRRLRVNIKRKLLLGVRQQHGNRTNDLPKIPIPPPTISGLVVAKNPIGDLRVFFSVPFASLILRVTTHSFSHF